MLFEIAQAQNWRTNNIKRKIHRKKWKTEIKILANPGLTKSGFEQPAALGGERHGVFPKNTTQCPWPGLEYGPLKPETSALSIRPPRLP